MGKLKDQLIDQADMADLSSEAFAELMHKREQELHRGPQDAWDEMMEQVLLNQPARSRAKKAEAKPKSTRKRSAVVSTPPSTAGRSLTGLQKLTDWIPFRGIRTCQRKLLADDLAEIQEFKKQGRFRLARWRAFWTWIHWLQYLLSSPLAAAMSAWKKFQAG